MSTNFNQYLVLGVKTPFFGTDDDKFHDNGYRKEIGHHDGITLIADGMDGEYCIIGKVLFKGELNQPLEGQIGIDAKMFADAQEVGEKLKKYFQIENYQVKLWFLTFWH